MRYSFRENIFKLNEGSMSLNHEIKSDIENVYSHWIWYELHTYQLNVASVFYVIKDTTKALLNGDPTFIWYHWNDRII